MIDNLKLKARLLLLGFFLKWVLSMIALVAFGYFTSWKAAICLLGFTYLSEGYLKGGSGLIELAFPKEKNKKD